MRRIPFYFYVPPVEKPIDAANNSNKSFRSLECIIGSIYDNTFTAEHPLEQVYVELEYLFYEKKLPLTRIFSYLIEQYKVVNAPFLQWAKYIHLCDSLGWVDYFPKSFISKFNLALEESGQEPIIYEVENIGINGESFFRNGNIIEFRGQFPMDEAGNPVLRWTNIKVRNPVSITCNQEKSYRNTRLVIELSPRTVIYERYMGYSDTETRWHQIYVGPFYMEFDHRVIKAQRERLKFTQQEVADAVGATVRTYQKWEAGTTTPDGHYLLRLMNWLDLPDPQFVTAYKDFDFD